jgi:molybdopterin synthase catalytic subunit
VSVSVQQADFDAGAELARLRSAHPGAGAVASFVGSVRAHGVGEAIHALFLEHYPGMTEAALQSIVDEARQRWPIESARVVHRVGRLLPNEQIVLVAVAAGHRREAFQACEFIVDYLKTRAPFWKREETAGGSRWVEARASDEAAAARWTQPDGA